MIIVNAKFFVKAEARTNFLEEIQGLIASSKQEVGCSSYELYESVSHENEFVMIENWETVEANQAHNTNPLLVAFAKNIASYSVAKPILQVVEMKGE